jgi:hypothetical protein
MSDNPTLAWWFAAGDTLPNEDGRKIVVGERLTVPGPLVLCQHGLHGSIRCLDALGYAPGQWLHRTRHAGEILVDGDKLCSTARTVLARVDFTAQLRLFARQCAADVLHLWEAPQVVRDYLATGDETLRPAARAAAWAAGDAAWAAARAAARAAAWEEQNRTLEQMAMELIDAR